MSPPVGPSSGTPDVTGSLKDSSSAGHNSRRAGHTFYWDHVPPDPPGEMLKLDVSTDVLPYKPAHG